MSSNNTFTELIRRVRSGDVEAARELVRLYEPAIRREARLRLGPSLRPLLDSIDICQSVFGSFFIRAYAGEYEIESPARLMRLLLAMAKNKVREAARRRRDRPIGEKELRSNEEEPFDTLMASDLIDAFKSRLGPEELELWARRRAGEDWAAIAATAGEPAPALRQRYSRAIRRVASQLQLGGGYDGVE